MSKKYLLLPVLLVFLVIGYTNVRAEEEVLFRTGTNIPIKFQETNIPVTIPVEYNSQKQEFRGMWVATVENIDIPRQFTIEQYQNEFIEILDNLKSINMNAIVFQIRPMNDAFYQSNLNPWSKYLTGTQGKDPGWDPLAWMVEQSHKRGIEFHAWLNPYRVSNKNYEDLGFNSKEEYLATLDELNFARIHPEFVLEGGQKKLILNPGEPEVRQFIFDTIDEIASKYDVDAIHFDDYFYPYDRIDSSEDADTFNNNNPHNLSLDNWRRENVDLLIKGIKDVLTEYNQLNNKGVQLGISPFGIWANKTEHPLGSNTRGGNSYFSHYADTRKWVKEEWIDYIVPQIYWSFELDIAAYHELVTWWVNTVNGTNVNLYIGQGMYRYALSSGSKPEWANEQQIPNHLLFNQKYDEIKGNVFFSYKDFFNSNNTAANNAFEIIKNEFYNNMAISPVVKNIISTKVTAVDNLTVERYEDSFKVNWDNNTNAKMYILYKFTESDTVDLNNSSKIIYTTYNTNENVYEYIDNDIKSGIKYKYILTALDKANNESESTIVETNRIEIKPKIYGYNDINVEAKDEEPNYLENITAFDGYGNNITNLIEVDDSKVNKDVIGDYLLTYKATDNKGYYKEITVNVYVRDNLIPKITLKKDLNLYLNSEKTNWEEYIDVYDLFDGNLFNQLVIDDSKVDLTKLGKYYIKCTITDSNNNFSKKFFDVYVIEEPLDENSDFNLLVPIISLVLVMSIISVYYIVKNKK